MANGGDDTISCLALIGLVGLGIYALFRNYEIREREVEVPAAPAPLIPLRPTGSIAVASTPSGAIYSLQADSVSGPRQNRRAWVFIDHSRDPEVSYRTTKEFIWTNCDTGEIRTLSRTLFDAQGKSVYSENYSLEDAESNYYAPNAIGRGAPDEMCKPAFGP